MISLYIAECTEKPLFCNFKNILPEIQLYNFISSLSSPKLLPAMFPQALIIARLSQVDSFFFFAYYGFVFMCEYMYMYWQIYSAQLVFVAAVYELSDVSFFRESWSYLGLDALRGTCQHTRKYAVKPSLLEIAAKRNWRNCYFCWQANVEWKKSLLLLPDKN